MNQLTMEMDGDTLVFNRKIKVYSKFSTFMAFFFMFVIGAVFLAVSSYFIYRLYLDGWFNTVKKTIGIIMFFAPVVAVSLFIIIFLAIYKFLPKNNWEKLEITPTAINLTEKSRITTLLPQELGKIDVTIIPKRYRTISKKPRIVVLNKIISGTSEYQVLDQVYFTIWKKDGSKFFQNTVLIEKYKKAHEAERIIKDYFSTHFDLQVVKPLWKKIISNCVFPIMFIAYFIILVYCLA